MSACKGKGKSVDKRDNARIREILWKSAGRKSVREIAEETGLTPEEVLVQKREMFEELDVLTVEQERMKIMVAMRQIADEALKKLQDGVESERNFAGIVNAAVNTQEKLMRSLNTLGSEQAGAVDALNELRVREILRLMDRVVAAGAKELSADHGLDENEVLEVFAVALEHEARVMDLNGGGD